MLISRLFALGIVITLGLSVIGALSVSSHTTQDWQGFQRARDADLARWVEMGKAYTQRELDNMQRARDADVARWVAMGVSYKLRVPSDGQ